MRDEIEWGNNETSSSSRDNNIHNWLFDWIIIKRKNKCKVKKSASHSFYSSWLAEKNAGDIMIFILLAYLCLYKCLLERVSPACEKYFWHTNSKRGRQVEFEYKICTCVNEHLFFVNANDDYFIYTGR